MDEHTVGLNGKLGESEGMNPMRIWIDVNTPKQVLFFAPLVKELERRGHTTHVTSRHYREAEGLISKTQLSASIVGKHGGGSLLGKLIASSERIRALAGLVPDWDPDITVHFASPECARVAFGLGIPQICISDCPQTEAVDRLTLPLVDRLMTPWVIPYHRWSRYGVKRGIITRYKALDPAAWLKRSTMTGPLNVSKIGADPHKKTITVRYEESQASYLLASDNAWGTSIIEGLISKFGGCNIIVSSRYEDQIAMLEQRYGGNAIILKDVVDGVALLRATELFVGMGGTMTIEAALLGVPTISGYQGTEELDYFSYLVKQKLLMKSMELNEILMHAEALLNDRAKRELIEKRAKSVLERMEDPVERIVSEVEGFKKTN